MILQINEKISLYVEEYGSGDRYILSAQVGFYPKGMQRMTLLPSRISLASRSSYTWAPLTVRGLAGMSCSVMQSAFLLSLPFGGSVTLGCNVYPLKKNEGAKFDSRSEHEHHVQDCRLYA